LAFREWYLHAQLAHTRCLSRLASAAVPYEGCNAGWSTNNVAGATACSGTTPYLLHGCNLRVARANQDADD